MKNLKKTLAALLAVSCALGVTACGDSGSSTSSPAPAAGTTAAAGGEDAPETTTTTAATVAVNTETLNEEQQSAIDSAGDKLRDVELENKTVKWLCHWDINPDNTGKSIPVDLAMFQNKYGGEIKWYPTTWENRYNDLSTYVLGGEGIDFFQRDESALPKGVASGMFEAIDDYIDINSDLYKRVKPGMDIYQFKGKHYAFVKGVVADSAVIYSKKTIEENGFDDPWELYEKGEWNWDTFSKMLEDFVDPDNDCYGIDGWWAETPLYLSGGMPAISSVDGQLQVNLKDPKLEKAMNFAESLYTKGLVFDKSLFDWNVQTQFMGEGKELFFLCGTWALMSDPSTWSCAIPADEVDWVPVPNAADSDDIYVPATCDGFCLCKGAANPLGVALYVECCLAAADDPDTKAVNEQKFRDDFQWSDELIDHYNQINALAEAHPVVELAGGSIDDTDIQQTFINDDQHGMKGAFHGTPWSQTREEFSGVIDAVVSDLNGRLNG